MRTRPASCSAGFRHRSPTTPPAAAAAGGSPLRSSTRSSTTACSARSTSPSGTARSSVRPWSCASCAATLAEPPAGASWPSGPELQVEVDADHNLALITVHTPGADLEAAVAAERHHLFHRACLDAVYIDLPLEQPATALVADHLERLGVSYAGVFPNSHCNGDVLRMQSLHRVRIKADDVAVASDHGRELLDYVLADLPRLERTSREARCAPTLRLTRCRALSTVLVSHSSRSAVAS